MKSTELFSIIESVDSTNNYAMAKIHAGMAKHGMAWFAHEQLAGKGQFGKNWESKAGQNITLSVAITPAVVFSQNQFYFNAVIALACREFYNKYAGDDTFIKWPNDIYWRDRKAGGILIENKIMGKSWKWAVVGIGININQTSFSNNLANAVSMKQITGKTYDPVLLAMELTELILSGVSNVKASQLPGIIMDYNEILYKKDQKVMLKKDDLVFETYIKRVNELGQLITFDSNERQFNFGEVEFIGQFQ